MFTPELYLLFPLAASSPSFFKFPNKSQQIDTYRSPPSLCLVLSVAVAEQGDL